MKGFCRRLAHLAILATLPAASLAAGAQEDAPVALPDTLGFGGNLVGVTLNLLMVLAAIVILAWVFKRAQGFTQPAAGSLRVTATLPLGPRERILLIAVGDEQIVVGASGAGLRTLHVLEQPLPDAPHGPVVEGTFRERLLKTLGRTES